MTDEEGNRLLDAMNERDWAFVKTLTVPKLVEWTGWKPENDWQQGGRTTWWDRGLVSQWCDYRNGREGPFYYVTLPSMKYGSVPEGAIIDLGEGRVDLGSSDTAGLLQAGLDRILERVT
jgi:hypothetical protein